MFGAFQFLHQRWRLDHRWATPGPASVQRETGTQHAIEQYP